MKKDIIDLSHGFLILLLAADSLFILIHFLSITTNIVSDPSFSIERDRGYPEVFQYLKEFWIALLFFFLAVKKRAAVYFVWSLLFLTLLIDDYSQYHEFWGASLSIKLNLPPIFYLRAMDIGEILISFSLGTIFLLLMSFTYLLADSSSKGASNKILILLALLAFFGVVIDMIHIVIRSTLGMHFFYDFMGLVEDGGEHIVMSIITWSVFTLISNQLDTAPVSPVASLIDN